LIDTLSRTVSQSIGSTERPWKVDKETMRRLLSLSPFVLEKRRDLELYFRQVEPGIGEILVLDNELPLYGKTTLDDVTLRKSPVLKEMISIRNVIKILHDSDVIMSKGRDALRYVHDRALDLLDLRFEEKDIEEMANDGIDALAREDSEVVMETLDLFVELLGYESVPAAVLVDDCVMFGSRHEAEDGKEAFNPIIMYNDRTNILRLIEGTVHVDDPLEQELIPRVALGEVEPDAEGDRVFRFLKEAVMKKERPVLH
jgi:nitroreductase